MLFEIKKLFEVNKNNGLENIFYNYFSTEYSDFVITKEKNKIVVKPKSQWGLYYNSFRPEIQIQFLENTLTVTFKLQLFAKIICILIWAVGLFYGGILLVNDKDIVGALVSSLSFVVLSYLFSMKGLSLGSLKHINAIEKIVKQSNQSNQSEE